MVSTKERPIDRGRRLARADRIKVGAEIRSARAAGGRSLGVVAPLSGMSTSQVGRIERGVLGSVSVDQLARLGAVVGLDIRVHAYPGPDPTLDTAQLELLARLRVRLHPSLSFRTEVPLPIAGDQRAFDATVGRFIDVPGERLVAVEAVSRLVDAQAEHRRIRLKARDAGIDDVILLVADTRHDRAAFDASRAFLGSEYPVSARVALAALGAGRYPGGSAVIRL